jgi:hypothetical protein
MHQLADPDVEPNSTEERRQAWEAKRATLERRAELAVFSILGVLDHESGVTAKEVGATTFLANGRNPWRAADAEPSAE